MNKVRIEGERSVNVLSGLIVFAIVAAIMGCSYLYCSWRARRLSELTGAKIEWTDVLMGIDDSVRVTGHPN